LRLNLADIDRWTTKQENFYDASDNRLETPTVLRENNYSSLWYDTSQQAEIEKVHLAAKPA